MCQCYCECEKLGTQQIEREGMILNVCPNCVLPGDKEIYA